MQWHVPIGTWFYLSRTERAAMTAAVLADGIIIRESMEDK